MNDEKFNNEQVVDNSKVEDKNLNLDTPNEEKEEVILDLSSTTTTDVNSNSTLVEEDVSRGKVEIDMEEYVDFSELGKNKEVVPITNESMPTSIESNATIDRNKVDTAVKDINNLDAVNDTDGDGEVTQEELDENINSTTKVNEAGKKEIRMEVNETVTRVHEKDRKVKKLIAAVFIVIGIVILILIRGAIIDNKYDIFIRDVKTAAQKYMEDDSNASYVYALYNETIDELTISVSDLKRRGFIDFELIDPKTKDDMSDTKVVVTLEGGTLVYTYPA